MQYMDMAVKKIMSEYDADRADAHRKREENIKKVEKNVPEIKEINEKITKLGIENFGNILQNPEKAEELNKKFERELGELNLKKKEILKINNIPEDYDEVKYKCERCMDTGYIDTKKCPCFIKKLVDVRYKFSNMGGQLHDFSEFLTDYYGDKKLKNGMTERENIEDILEKTKQFCDNKINKNLLYSGGCGLGKTYLSSCVAKNMMDNGKSVIYLSATGLFSDYDEYRFGRKEEFAKVEEMIYEADLLIIDDLGAEAENPAGVQFLFDIINKRTSENKKMIISTNLNLKGIKNFYTERIVSRIIENFMIFTFEGTDIRIQKLKNQKG